jgi:hypothetical protein
MAVHPFNLVLVPLTLALFAAVGSGVAAPAGSLPPSVLREATPLTKADRNQLSKPGVSVLETADYVFGGYTGPMPSPPHADLNPKHAFIISWENFPFRFVFAHEGSYCPWLEFPSGAGHCFQFFEGNDGWAELFNNFGRQETNSFVQVLERGPKQVHLRWTYFGVNQANGARAYRATEDFWAFPNGHILRRQSFNSLMPGDPRGYAREPIEMIGMCPKDKLWPDILRRDPATGDSHALAVLDAFSTNRYDIFWRHQPNTLYKATPRRTGSPWKVLDDSRGVALITPLREGAAFCVLGDAGGFDHGFTRLKDHSFTDTGGIGWVSQSWDHWPIGWLNSQANEVNADSLKKYPNHFSPAGMDLFALPNHEVERRDFYSLIGVGGNDLEAVRKVARGWLSSGENNVHNLEKISSLPATAR